MKKVYILISLILALSITTVASAATIVNSKSDKIEISEKVLFGDRTFADGVTVLTKNEFQKHLFWETEFKIGKKNQIKTAYSFSFSEKIQDHQYERFNIQISDAMYSSFNENEPLNNQIGLGIAFKKLFDSTENGATKTATVYLKDYYTYYPLLLDFDLPNTVWDYEPFREVGGKPFDPKYVADKFRDYFKIPVLANDKAEIEVSKYEDGRLYGTSYGETDHYNIYTTSTYSDNECFFSINNKVYTKEAIIYVDTSLIPDGYGIYSFKYGRSKKEYHTGIDADSLKTVYPLNKEVTVETMGINNDQSMLYFISTEQDNVYFNLLDIKTMTMLKKTKIEGGFFCNAKQYEDFIIVYTENKLSVISTKNNNFSLELTSKRSDKINSNFQSDWYDEFHAFNNGRLITVGSLIHNEFGDKTCDFYISVYSNDRLAYYGEYQNSLSLNNNYQYYNGICHPYEYNALEIIY